MIIKHPDVKTNLAQDKVLEQVLINYIATIPKSQFRNSNNNMTHHHDSNSISNNNVTATTTNTNTNTNISDVSRKENIKSSTTNINNTITYPTQKTKFLVLSNQPHVDSKKLSQNHSTINAISGYPRHKKDKSHNNNSHTNNSNNTHPFTTPNTNAANTTTSTTTNTSLELLTSRHGLNCCYFCLKPDPTYAIPACCVWKKSNRSIDQNGNNNNYNNNNASTTTSTTVHDDSNDVDVTNTNATTSISSESFLLYISTSFSQICTYLYSCDYLML